MIDSLNDWHFKSPWNFIKVEDYTPTLPFIQEFENPRSLFFNHYSDYEQALEVWIETTGVKDVESQSLASLTSSQTT